MNYVQAFDRDQIMMTTWDSMVAPDSKARLIDAFVNGLILSDFDVKEITREDTESTDQEELKKALHFGVM